MGNTALDKYSKQTEKRFRPLRRAASKLRLLVNKANTEEREISNLLQDLSKTVNGLQGVHNQIQTINGDIQAAEQLINEQMQNTLVLSQQNKLTNAERALIIKETKEFIKEITKEQEAAIKALELSNKANALSTLLRRNGTKLKRHVTKLRNTERGIKTQLRTLDKHGDSIVGNMKYLPSIEERSQWEKEAKKPGRKRKRLVRKTTKTKPGFREVVGTTSHRWVRK